MQYDINRAKLRQRQKLEKEIVDFNKEKVNIIQPNIEMAEQLKEEVLWNL